MKPKYLLQDISLWLYLFSIAIIAGATVFQMMVIVPEFSRDAPNGMIELAQSNIQPRNFWVSPIVIAGDLMAIVAVIANWKTARRKWVLLSFAFVAAAVVITGMYFIPRLKIMGLIDGDPSGDISLLKRTIPEWVKGDIIRFWILVVPAFFLALKAVSVSLINKEEKATFKKFETAIAN